MGDVSEKICTISLIIEVDCFIGFIQYVWVGREGVKNYTKILEYSRKRNRQWPWANEMASKRNETKDQDLQ